MSSEKRVSLQSVVIYTENDDPSSVEPLRPKYRFSLADVLGPSASYGTNGIQDVGDNETCAVVVRNASKSYGSSAIIEGLNMTIKQGTIYSLLGSSGCGKSTTLECIVGLRKFTSGDVWVFGKEPGSRGSSVPGKCVGYMPQDYSLYNDFSVCETFMYFGTMNGMDEYKVMQALIFYTDLLQLPQHYCRIATLSGGQKRRVSFAVALMHNPPLLILDEPTVGVDPLVRQSIWEHLTDLTQTKATTVLITTHYTDEARHSDTIAVMRNGRLIVEKSPGALLLEHNTISLEAVVLEVCKSVVQQVSRAVNQQDPPEIDEDNDSSSPEEGLQSKPKHILPSMVLSGDGQLKRKTFQESIARTRALTKKNTYLWQRNIAMLMMSIMFPAGGIFVALLSTNNPTYMKVGVVNGELNGSATCDQLNGSWNGTCNVDLWSCKYLSHLDYPEFVLFNYDTIQDAERAVELGHIWGFIMFPPEYSIEFFERASAGANLLDPESFNTSSIQIRLDNTNAIIATQMKFSLLEAYGSYLKHLLTDCGLSSKKAEYSLDYKEPIAGKKLSFGDFTIPGSFIGYMFFWPIITSGIRYVNEKREGTMERSIVAGVQMWEIFISFSATETIIAVLRMFVMYGIAIWIFDMKIMGSLLYEAVLGLLASYTGIAAGFLFGSFCTEEIQVALLAMAIFLPNSLLSGIYWPTEGMPVILQKIAYLLPITLTCDSMRSMTNRGWGPEIGNVWAGFVMSFGYTLFFFLAAFVISTRKFIK